MVNEQKNKLENKIGEIIGYLIFVASFLVFTLQKNLTHFLTWILGSLLLIASFVLLVPSDLIFKNIDIKKRIKVKWSIVFLLIILISTIYFIWELR